MADFLEGVVIVSRRTGHLAQFYEQVVGLRLAFTASVTGVSSQLYAFAWPGGSRLYISPYLQKKKFPAARPRMTINIGVTRIKDRVRELDAAGVKKITPLSEVENFGWIAIFSDPDGNYFQLVERYR